MALSKNNMHKSQEREKAVLQIEKVVERGTGVRAKSRAASVLMTLIAMSALVGLSKPRMCLFLSKNSDTDISFCFFANR